LETDSDDPIRSAGLPIEKLDVAIEFNAISDQVWFLVKKWPLFEMDTVGKQLVTSIDSVAANIIEGGHRDSDLDALRHFIIARASAGEAANWLNRVAARRIEPEEGIVPLVSRVVGATKRLERLIQFRRNRSSKRKPT
jgi:four helix bundle protein